MVGFPLEDGECPVKLFCKNRSNHLMRKRHFGQRKFVVAACIYFRRKAVGASYYKYDVASAADHYAAKPLRPFERAHLLSAFVQQDDVIGWLDVLEYQFSFLLFDLFVGKG